MNQQVNLRLPGKLLDSAKSYADSHGYGTLQEFIKETLREKVFEPGISEKEMALIRRLLKASEAKNLYGTEKELFESVRKKKR